MENSYLFTQDDREDQLLLFIQEFIKSSYESGVNILTTSMHYIFFPVVLIYSFWAHALEQTWQITKLVSNEIFELMKIVPLTFELWYWSTLICLQVVFFFKGTEEATVDVEKRVYGKLKEILRKLNAFPLSKQNAAALYSFMMRIPIFGKGRLPFPKFLFEDTFTKINFKKGEISMTMPLSSDLPQLGAEPSAQIHTSTLTEDSGEDSSEAKAEAMTESRRSSTKPNKKYTLANPSSAAGSSESDVETSGSA